MSDPTTEAGKRLLAMHADCAPMTACTMHGDLAAAVVAIEVERIPLDAVVTEEALAQALHKVWCCRSEETTMRDHKDAAAILAALREEQK